MVRPEGSLWWASGMPLAPNWAVRRPRPWCTASVWPQCLPWMAWCMSPWKTTSPPGPRYLRKRQRNAHPERAPVQHKVESHKRCWVSHHGRSVCWIQSPPLWHRCYWCRRHFLPSSHGGWCCCHAVRDQKKRFILYQFCRNWCLVSYFCYSLNCYIQASYQIIQKQDEQFYSNVLLHHKLTMCLTAERIWAKTSLLSVSESFPSVVIFV